MADCIRVFALAWPSLQRIRLSVSNQIHPPAIDLIHRGRMRLCGSLDHEDVLGHMRTADVVASPSTRKWFGITFLKPQAVDCTVIAADHSKLASDEVITDAGFLVAPTEQLDAALSGAWLATEPAAHTQGYDWDAIARQAENAYERVIDKGVVKKPRQQHSRYIPPSETIDNLLLCSGRSYELRLERKYRSNLSQGFFTRIYTPESNPTAHVEFCFRIELNRQPDNGQHSARRHLANVVRATDRAL